MPRLWWNSYLAAYNGVVGFVPLPTTTWVLGLAGTGSRRG